MHKSVLLQETIDGLDIKAGDTVVDATLGGGGHAEEILRRFGDEVAVVGIDADSRAIERAEKKIGRRDNFIAVCENFRNIDSALGSAGVEKADKFLFDLGLSSDQLQESGRGFSFQKDEPLLMTLASNPEKDATTAEQIVNEWSAASLESIIKGYGEERFAKRIAEALVQARKSARIETAAKLAALIESAVPRRGKIHPATKTFQALRIAVNDEISALEEGLSKSFARLKEGGRIAVISFHSIEDRVVKRFFKEIAKRGEGKIITKKPITPQREEILENPRARSAKLRIIEKI